MIARLAVAIVLALIPGAVLAEPLADCRQTANARLRLDGCTAVIADASASRADKAVAYRNRGNARLDAGALDQAQADLEEAIKLAPNDDRALVLRAQVHMGRKDTDRAIADYNAAVRINPNSTTALNGRGYAELVRGNATAAIADFSKVISLSPVSAVAYNNRGLAHRRTGDLDRAVADYTAAINLNPIYALAYENRGHAREAQGNKPFAVADFRRALLIDPSLSGSRTALARLGESTSESDTLISEGRGLVEAHCSRCHATGTTGDSPNAKAPAFRHLHGRHPILALREPLTRGIAAPHDEMPYFALPDSAVDKIVAYINSLSGGR